MNLRIGPRAVLWLALLIAACFAWGWWGFLGVSILSAMLGDTGVTRR